MAKHEVNAPPKNYRSRTYVSKEQNFAKHPRDPSTVLEYFRLRSQGMPLERIAQRHGRSRQTIHYIMHRWQDWAKKMEPFQDWSR